MAQGFAFDGQSLITPGQIIRPNDHSNLPSAEQLILAKAELALALDLCLQQFQSGVDAHAIIRRVTDTLHQLRRRFHARVWDEIIPLVQAHPVTAFVFQDPFTRWSFDKPRGYSGDAHLLDFIYGNPEVDAEIAASTELGKAIYAYTRNASSSVAVRERRDLLARRVDEMASLHEGQIEILAVASGHLREATLSMALRDGKIKRWVALDQDPLSVGTVTRDFAGSAVEAVNGSVRTLISGKHELGTLDLVYAAGLYDYLADPVAVKLTKTCMRMVKPGGSFLFANFSQATRVDGYMETFMNWPLLLRTEDDMRSIAEAAAGTEDVSISVWSGENLDVIYCEIKCPQ